MSDVLRLPATRMPPSATAGLLDLLEKGGGSIQVSDPPEEVRAAWRRLLHAVRQGGEVPPGWHLLHRGRNTGDLTIELRPGEHPADRYRRSSDQPTIQVPAELADPHPVVDRLRDQPHRLPASPANRSRTLMIAQALAEAASAKGYAVMSGEQDTLVVFEVSGSRFGLRIAEQAGKRWTLRLILELDGPGAGQAKWVDYARRRVEDELPEVLAEMENRAAAIGAEQEARCRAEEQRLAEIRERRITKRRDEVLRGQVAAWKLAQRIRAHCVQLIDAGLPADDRWVVWANAYAEEIDPLSNPPVAPPDPSEEEQDQERARMPTFETPPSKPWHPNRRWYNS